MTRPPEKDKAKEPLSSDKHDHDEKTGAGATGKSAGKRSTFPFTYDADNGLLDLIFKYREALFTRGNTIKTWEMVLDEFNRRFEAGILQTRTINNRFKALRKNLEKKLLNEQGLIMELGLNENENLLVSLNEYLSSKKSGTAAVPPSKRARAYPPPYQDAATEPPAILTDSTTSSPLATTEMKSSSLVTSPAEYKSRKTSLTEKPSTRSPKSLATAQSSATQKPVSYIFNQPDTSIEVQHMEDPSQGHSIPQLHHAPPNPHGSALPVYTIGVGSAPAPGPGRIFQPMGLPLASHHQLQALPPARHSLDSSFEKEDVPDYEIDPPSRKRKQSPSSAHTRSREDVLEQILESQNRLNDHLDKLDRDFRQFKMNVDYQFSEFKEMLARNTDRVDLKLDSFYRALLAHAIKPADHRR